MHQIKKIKKIHQIKYAYNQFTKLENDNDTGIENDNDENVDAKNIEIQLQPNYSNFSS